MSDSSFKLPLLAGRKKLPALPGQQKGVQYGVIWDACPIPERGSCYVVRFESSSTVSILAYVDNRGGVFHVDHPITLAPAGEPDLAAVPDSNGHEGTLYVKDAHAALQPHGRYHGAFSGLMREVGDTETWNTQRSLGYRPFMASVYLRLCVIDGASSPRPDLDGAAVDAAPRALGRKVSLFADFSSTPLPDAIDALLYRIAEQRDPSGIELFARRVLSSIDLERLRSIVAKSPVSLVRIDRMDGFYLVFDRGELDADEERFVLAAEAAINRVYRVLAALGFGLAPATSSPSEEACSVLDQHSFREVTGHVEKLLSRAVAPNPWIQPGSLAAKPGGEWDMRTRFASLCESLNLIARFEYGFQCASASRGFTVEFVEPSSDAMPAEAYDQEMRAWRRLDEEGRSLLADEYACRMSLVAAAAAFASSLMVSSCAVVCRDAVTREPRRAFFFERTSFTADVVPLAERLCDQQLRSGAARRALSQYACKGPVRPVCDEACFVSPRDDGRRLPPGLQRLLLADTASELEVMEAPDDPYMARLHELRERMPQDRDGAVAGFIELVGELEASCAAAELLSDRPMRSEFCESYLGRIVVPLTVDDPETRIHRVPDALFFAQYELGDAYFRAGDLDRALVEARKLLDMAATSMQAHFMMVNVLARMERFQEVAEVVRHGARVSYDRESLAYLYYRGAFAFWALGERETALALYCLIPHGGHLGELAQAEMQPLMAEMDRTERPGIEEVAAVVRSAGLAMPPDQAVVDQISDAAVLLADNGFFHLANRCVRGMWHIMGHDELGVVSRSLLPEPRF